MKQLFRTFIVTSAVAVLFASCNNGEIVHDTPDAPTTGYHLTFDGGVGIETGTRAVWNDDNGSGNLIFQWDYTPEGTEDYEMVMAIVGGELVKTIEGNYHTYASIHKNSAHSDDAHWATFKTIETYPYDITGGKYEGFDVLAVAPICEANGASIVSHDIIFDATMLMPATFTQVADQEPDFLRNYMYMYAYEMIDNNRATLRFKHIPATFRFIITNKRPTEATIKSVQVSQTDAALPVASKWVSIDFQGNLSFSRSTHAAISTQLGENGTTVQKDAKYTAYALALPLADNNAFEDKKIQFTIEALGPDNEHLSFVLDADKLAAANPNNEYNWVGGKSYTIHMCLDDGLLVQDITVNDWNEQDISGGEAVEWVNG
ncbi:MAG: hypothetical protein IJZ45_09225, partial [Bacteroidaceae bacterium]|nr:hypothetical protein [Bacteroidaceae bacterium]